MTRWSLPLAVTVIVAAIFCGGCMKVSMDVAVAPDLSQSARLTAATDVSLAEMGEEGKLSGGLGTPPSNWKTREYRDGKWQVQEAVTTVAPGEPLFPDGGEAPSVKIETSRRRLSTRYHVTMTMPPPPPVLTEQITPVEGQDKFEGLARSLMSDLEFRLTLSAPGEIIASSGQPAGPGKAEWRLGLAEFEKSGTIPAFRLTTELPNWITIGNLANQVAMAGGPADAGSRIGTALQRRLLPNPPITAAADEKLGPQDYLRLLEIIGKLDAGAGPAVTDAVISQSRLNDEDVTAQKLERAHQKIMKMDVGELVEQASVKAIAGGLR